MPDMTDRDTVPSPSDRDGGSQPPGRTTAPPSPGSNSADATEESEHATGIRSWLGVAIYWMEALSGALLVVLAALALLNFTVIGWEALVDDVHLDSTAILELVDAILVFFIVIELFKIAIAYMSAKGDIVHTVLEAALVAIARKLVVFVETEVGALEKAIALALLVLGVGVTWFLLERAGVRGGPAPHIAEE